LVHVRGSRLGSILNWLGVCIRKLARVFQGYRGGAQKKSHSVTPSTGRYGLDFTSGRKFKQELNLNQEGLAVQNISSLFLYVKSDPFGQDSKGVFCGLYFT